MLDNRSDKRSSSVYSMCDSRRIFIYIWIMIGLRKDELTFHTLE